MILGVHSVSFVPRIIVRQQDRNVLKAQNRPSLILGPSRILMRPSEFVSRHFYANVLCKLGPSLPKISFYTITWTVHMATTK